MEAVFVRKMKFIQHISAVLLVISVVVAQKESPASSSVATKTVSEQAKPSPSTVQSSNVPKPSSSVKTDETKPTQSSVISSKTEVPKATTTSSSTSTPQSSPTPSSKPKSTETDDSINGMAKRGEFPFNGAGIAMFSIIGAAIILSIIGCIIYRRNRIRRSRRAGRRLDDIFRFNGGLPQSTPPMVTTPFPGYSFSNNQTTQPTLPIKNEQTIPSSIAAPKMTEVSIQYPSPHIVTGVPISDKEDDELARQWAAQMRKEHHQDTLLYVTSSDDGAAIEYYAEEYN